MGWTGIHASYYKNGKVDRKAECDAMFLEGSCRGHYEILRSSMVGSVYYAAIRTLRRYIGEDADGNSLYEPILMEDQTIWGLVMLTRVDNKNYHNFYYKDMSEDMGPCYYDCPESILNLLSPTKCYNANEWRRRCCQVAEKKRRLNSVPVGKSISFRSRFNMMSGIKEGDEVILTKNKRYGSSRTYWFDGRYRWKSTYIPNSFDILA